MDGTLHKISFLKLQGRGAPITPWDWMCVDGMDLDHNIHNSKYSHQDLSNEGSKKIF